MSPAPPEARRIAQRLAAAGCLPIADPVSESERDEYRDRYPEVVSRYEEFFGEHADLLTGAVCRSPVCIVTPWTWNQARDEGPEARRVLVDLLWSEGRMAEWMPAELAGIDTLRAYSLLVLYGLETMDEPVFNAVKGFVMAGGRLIALGPTGRLAPGGQPRPDDAVEELFGPRHVGQDWDTVQARLAKGRATSFPTVKLTELAQDPHVRKQFLYELDQLAGPRPLAHNAPATMTACLTDQPAASRLVLHLVNRGPAPLERFHVALAIAGLDFDAIAVHSPDASVPDLRNTSPVPGGAHAEVVGLDVLATLVLPYVREDG